MTGPPRGGRPPAASALLQTGKRGLSRRLEHPEYPKTHPEHQNGKAGGWGLDRAGQGACHSVILSFCHVFNKKKQKVAQIGPRWPMTEGRRAVMVRGGPKNQRICGEFRPKRPMTERRHAVMGCGVPKNR